MYCNGKKSFAWFLIACLVLTQALLGGKANANAAQSKRLSGSDRYKTAVEISKEGWSKGANYVILARGNDFADALCAGPLAKKYGAPILLTQSDELNCDTLSELKRLAVKHIIIVGGVGAVSSKVEDALKSAGFTDIIRLAGDDRYDTSVKIAENIGAADKLVLATGEDYPDALSTSSIASKMRIPILLTQKDRLPDKVKQYIDGKKITQTYVIGGTGVINESIKASVPNSLRIGGKDRYETNVLIFKEFESNLDFSDIYLAVGNGPKGDEFADALAGAALAAQKSSPVVLAYKTLPAAAGDYLKSKISIASRITALGGEAVLPEAIADTLESYINEIKISASYDKSGKYGTDDGMSTVSGNAVISVGDVTIQNTVIEGDLLLEESIGSGSVCLKNVTVKGTTSIRCSGPDSIIMYSFSGQTVNVYAGRANFSLQSGSIRSVSISETAEGSRISLAGGTQVDTFTADSASVVTGQGHITRANVNAPGTSFEVWPGITYIADGITSNISGQDRTGIVTPPTPPTSSGGGYSGPDNKPTPDTTPPTAKVISATILVGSDVTTAQSTETGIIYLVPDNANITTKVQAEEAVAGGFAKKAAVFSANTNITISTTGLSAGSYKVVAADASGNLSAESSGTIELQAAPPPPENKVPAASNVSITGTCKVGETLTGNYDYSDYESDAESSSFYKWYSCDTVDGEYSIIDGAASTTFVITGSLLGKYIKFEVTPAAAAGASPGTAVQSAASGPVLAATLNTTWEKKYDERLSDVYPGNLDYRIDIKKAADDGYIIAGTTYAENAYLLKIGANGDKAWDSTLGYNTGEARDRIFSVLQTNDGGYIAAGETMGRGSDYGMDFYAVKTDATGVKVWDKAYGGEFNEQARSIQQTNDGGYIIAGMKYTDYERSWDFYLVKIDADGNYLWDKTYNRSLAYTNYSDYGYFVRQTSDDGYIIVGTSLYAIGHENIYIIKTDAKGEAEWSYSYGNDDGNATFDAVEADDGYIVTGYCKSTTAGHYKDLCLIKLDKNGTKCWFKTYANNVDTYGLGIAKTINGGYVIVGETDTDSVDGHQVYLLKTDADGNKIWENSLGGVSDDRGCTVLETGDGGFIIAGYTKAAGVGNIYVIKTDSNGNVLTP